MRDRCGERVGRVIGGVCGRARGCRITFRRIFLKCLKRHERSSHDLSEICWVGRIFPCEAGEVDRAPLRARRWGRVSRGLVRDNPLVASPHPGFAVLPPQAGEDERGHVVRRIPGFRRYAPSPGMTAVVRAVGPDPVAVNVRWRRAAPAGAFAPRFGPLDQIAPLAPSLTP